jgi:hypothetical protein
LNLNPNIQAKRGLIIIYNIVNGITTLKKLDHSNNFYKFEGKMNIPLRKNEKKFKKKKPNMFSSSISKNIYYKGTFQDAIRFLCSKEPSNFGFVTNCFLFVDVKR